MKRSQVQGHTGLHSDSLVSLTRTSKTGWLPDEFHPVVGHITARSSRITRLRADTWRDESELLQVMIIVLGQHILHSYLVNFMGKLLVKLYPQTISGCQLY